MSEPPPDADGKGETVRLHRTIEMPWGSLAVSTVTREGERPFIRYELDDGRYADMSPEIARKLNAKLSERILAGQGITLNELLAAGGLHLKSPRK